MESIVPFYLFGKALSKVFTPEVTNAALVPIATSIGETFADMWKGAVGYKLYYWSLSHKDKEESKYFNRKNLGAINDCCSKEFNKVDEKSLQPPDVSIASSAFDTFEKCLYNPFCKDMVAKLLASSINKEKCKLSHPRYAFIIKSLNELDYRILNDMSSKNEIIGISLINGNSEQFIIDTQLLSDESIEGIALSISNLISLGLIQFESYLFNKDYQILSDETEEYCELSDHDEYFDTKDGKVIKTFLEKYGYDAHIVQFYLTSLGKNFIEVCIK